MVASRNRFSQIEESLMSIIPNLLSHQCQRWNFILYNQIGTMLWRRRTVQNSTMCPSFQARAQRTWSTHAQNNKVRLGSPPEGIQILKSQQGMKEALLNSLMRLCKA